MSAEFIPFARFAAEPTPVVPEFEPVTPVVEAVRAVSIPADKALADLSDALRMGLGEEVVEEILAGIRSPRLATKARPLPLRDLTTPQPADAAEGREPKTPGIVVTRVGDLVQKVTVECACGERISLDCVY